MHREHAPSPSDTHGPEDQTCQHDSAKLSKLSVWMYTHTFGADIFLLLIDSDAPTPTTGQVIDATRIDFEEEEGESLTHAYDLPLTVPGLLPFVADLRSNRGAGD
jgi:hypothetical protein